MVIIDYYKSLGKGAKSKFIKDVVDLTGWSVPTFFMKFKKGKFKKLEEEAITNYIQECKENDRQDWIL